MTQYIYFYSKYNNNDIIYCNDVIRPWILTKLCFGLNLFNFSKDQINNYT